MPASRLAPSRDARWSASSQPAIAPVPQETVEAPQIRIPDTPPKARPRRSSRALDAAARYPWILGALALLAISTLLVL